MGTELKIRITDHEKIERQLEKMGASFREEVNAVDTYFNQPKGEVVKVTETDKGYFLSHLRSKEGKFEIVKKEKITDAEQKKEELSEKFGIYRVLKKKMRFFSFGEYTININIIEEIGEFLILEGENPTKDVIENRLGFKDPEYIEVPFSELKK